MLAEQITPADGLQPPLISIVERRACDIKVGFKA